MELLAIIGGMAVGFFIIGPALMLLYEAVDDALIARAVRHEERAGSPMQGESLNAGYWKHRQ